MRLSGREKEGKLELRKGYKHYWKGEEECRRNDIGFVLKVQTRKNFNDLKDLRESEIR